MVCKNKRLPFGSKDYKDYIQISTVDLLSSQISTVHYLSLHISIFNIFTPSFITHNSSLSIQNLHTHTHTRSISRYIRTLRRSNGGAATTISDHDKIPIISFTSIHTYKNTHSLLLRRPPHPQTHSRRQISPSRWR